MTDMFSNNPKAPFNNEMDILEDTLLQNLYADATNTDELFKSCYGGKKIELDYGDGLKISQIIDTFKDKHALAVTQDGVFLGMLEHVTEGEFKIILPNNNNTIPDLDNIPNFMAVLMKIQRLDEQKRPQSKAVPRHTAKIIPFPKTIPF